MPTRNYVWYGVLINDHYSFFPSRKYHNALGGHRRDKSVVCLSTDIKIYSCIPIINNGYRKLKQAVWPRILTVVKADWKHLTRFKDAYCFRRNKRTLFINITKVPFAIGLISKRFYGITHNYTSVMNTQMHFDLFSLRWWTRYWRLFLVGRLIWSVLCLQSETVSVWVYVVEGRQFKTEIHFWWAKLKCYSSVSKLSSYCIRLVLSSVVYRVPINVLYSVWLCVWNKTQVWLIPWPSTPL